LTLIHTISEATSLHPKLHNIPLNYSKRGDGESGRRKEEGRRQINIVLYKTQNVHTELGKRGELVSFSFSCTFTLVLGFR